MSLVRESKAAPVPDAASSRRPATHAEDPYGWAQEQAALLRTGKLDLIDAMNVADEIAEVAHYLADKLQSDLVRVIQHLVKWDYQPERRSRSWHLTIREHRRRVAYHLRRAPGLRSSLDEILVEAYQNARDEALMETDLADSTVPEAVCYDWSDIMERSIEWPVAQP